MAPDALGIENSGDRAGVGWRRDDRTGGGDLAKSSQIHADHAMAERHKVIDLRHPHRPTSSRPSQNLAVHEADPRTGDGGGPGGDSSVHGIPMLFLPRRWIRLSAQPAG